MANRPLPLRRATGRLRRAATATGAWLSRLGSAVPLVVVVLVTQAQAAQTGAEIAERCDQCHGPDGRSDDSEVPSIGGFSEFAIIDLLETYRQGLRRGTSMTLADGSETDMTQVVKALSEDEIEAVARHYSAQGWQPHEQPFDAAKARRGAVVHDVKCGKCHLEGGSLPESDLAITAGQWRTYLTAQFRDFDAGRRPMAAKMKKRYDTLSDADKEAIIELYVGAGKF